MPATEFMVQALIRMKDHPGGEHGYPEKFSQIVERYRADLVHQALVILGNKEDSEDAAQESLSQAFLNLEKLREPAKLSQWLRAINRNVALKILRRNNMSHEERLATGQLDATAAPRTTTTSKLPVDVAAMVHGAIDSLSEQFREVVVLRHLEKLTMEQIATRLQIPLGTVASRMMRGELMLARKLKTLIQQERHPK